MSYETVRDTFDVLLVPVILGLLALLWPAWVARKRRKNFEDLIRQELEEAKPYRKGLDSSAPWHAHLSRRFLHERIIGQPTENIDFVLSLEPALAYHLSQMWIAFAKGQLETKQGRGASHEQAGQFCWHLGETIRLLDRRGRTDLLTKVWEPWTSLVAEKYGDAK